MDIMRNMWVLNQNSRTPESQSSMGLVLVIVGLAVVIIGYWLYMKKNHAKANTGMKSGNEEKKSYSQTDKDIIDLITELSELIKIVKEK